MVQVNTATSPSAVTSVVEPTPAHCPSNALPPVPVAPPLGLVAPPLASPSPDMAPPMSVTPPMPVDAPPDPEFEVPPVPLPVPPEPEVVFEPPPEPSPSPSPRGPPSKVAQPMAQPSINQARIRAFFILRSRAGSAENLPIAGFNFGRSSVWGQVLQAQ